MGQELGSWVPVLCRGHWNCLQGLCCKFPWCFLFRAREGHLYPRELISGLTVLFSTRLSLHVVGLPLSHSQSPQHPAPMARHTVGPQQMFLERINESMEGQKHNMIVTAGSMWESQQPFFGNFKTGDSGDSLWE